MADFVLSPSNAMERWVLAWKFVQSILQHGLPVMVKVTQAPAANIRTLDQNSALQCRCRDVAQQVEWHGQKLSEDDWRHMFVAAYKGQRAVPGIEGGFVVLGGSSKLLSIAECAEVMTMIEAFGAEHNVKWSDA